MRGAFCRLGIGSLALGDSPRDVKQSGPLSTTDRKLYILTLDITKQLPSATIVKPLVDRDYAHSVGKPLSHALTITKRRTSAY